MHDLIHKSQGVKCILSCSTIGESCLRMSEGHTIRMALLINLVVFIQLNVRLTLM